MKNNRVENANLASTNTKVINIPCSEGIKKKKNAIAPMELPFQLVAHQTKKGFAIGRNRCLWHVFGAPINDA
eukprot:g80384.t1